MEEKIRQWLHMHNFCETTGFWKTQLIFVRTYSEKSEVVQNKKMSIFFDDHSKVIKSLAPLPIISRIY
jgi:hypothetical protein